jgi:hypothetical protein
VVLPFSAEQFFGVFAAYNQAVWPIQIVLPAVAIGSVLLAFFRPPGASQAIATTLGAFWIWMGVAYHWSYFADINPAARLFGAMFVIEGALFVWLGSRPERLRFEPTKDVFGVAGGVLVVYSLLVYPLLGMAMGRAYPANPTFGLPCPTTIFTTGMLLWARPRVPWVLLVVPAIWSVIGVTAVRYFGVVEDSMLPVAGILGGALVLWGNRRGGVADA